MSGIELVVTICLAAEPSVCEERHFPFYERTSIVECMVKAQPYLADWADANRRWTVKTWKCGYLVNQKRDA